MIRNPRPGEKVRLLVPREKVSKRETGEVISFWPREAVEGVISSVHREGRAIFVFVVTDHPGAIGKTDFSPKELERL